VYPLKEGKVDLTFDLVKKVTSDESVAYSFSGDRDNVKTLETTDTDIVLPPLTLNVRTLPKGTAIVGDFTLSSKFKTHEAHAYEPLPFQVNITGTGYPPLLETLGPSSDDISLFQEKATVKTVHTQKATQSSVLYPLALSANKSFDLPEINIKAFDPKREKSYTLTVPEQHFTVSQEASSALLDKSDDPKPFSTDWSWLTTLLKYLLVFAAGFLTALIWKGKKRTLIQESNPLKGKIASTKNEKELLQLLMATDNKRFASVIEKLEDGLYKKGKLHFKALKKEAEESV
jgi:hypothetical protein